MTTVVNILDYIPIGHDNAISRCDLRQLTKLSDRDMRHAIEHARYAGAPVINNGHGYFIPDSDDLEDVHQCREYMHAMSSRTQALEAGVEVLKDWLRSV